MIKKLNYDPWEQSSDDGVFWMPFTDFVQHFASVYVCYIFKDDGQPPAVIPDQRPVAE